MLNLKGIYPPITTPFHEDGALDLEGLRFNLAHLSAQPLRGIVAGGSNGEFSSLTIEERLTVVAASRKAWPADRLLIAGSGLETTAATVDLTQRMAGLGADAVLVVTPGYFRNKMSAQALIRHYTTVADASPVPVILYSVPANTGVDLQSEAAAELSLHPNVIGMKDSGGDITKMGRMVYECSSDFQLLAGSGGFFLAALAVGAVGGVMALANIAAEQLQAVQDAFERGDLSAARAAQLPLIALNSAVTARFGVAGLKAALDLIGLRGGLPRPPLMPASPSEIREIRGLLGPAGITPVQA
jgi:4-hydroxy-2-oxoglutarate aldolase